MSLLFTLGKSSTLVSLLLSEQGFCQGPFQEKDFIDKEKLLSQEYPPVFKLYGESRNLSPEAKSRQPVTRFYLRRNVLKIEKQSLKCVLKYNSSEENFATEILITESFLFPEYSFTSNILLNKEETFPCISFGIPDQLFQFLLRVLLMLLFGSDLLVRLD